jgi:hypothetical protein
METPRTAAHLRGVAVGALILTGFGSFWVLIALASWQPRPNLALAAGLAVTCGLLLAAVWRLVTAGRAPAAKDAEAAAARGRKAGLAFGLIFTLEGGLIALGAILLTRAGLPLWIPPLAALVVGIHFFPLAAVFGVPLYHWTGGAMVVWVLICASIDDVALRLLLLGLGVGGILWLTVGLALFSTRVRPEPAP